jgi:prophage tail gpP-like protein
MELVIFDRETNRKFEYFNDVKIGLRYDSVGSVFSFSMLFNPDDPNSRIITKPSSWQLAKIYEKGELLITGFILQYSFTLEANKNLVQVSGYSIPGVLEDSQIPLTAYPLQNDGLSLRQIVERILSPFQIKISIDESVASEMNKPYATSKASPTTTVKEYFTSLAKQRNIILGHTAGGRLLFTRANTDGAPVIDFMGGFGNYKITHNFNGQILHSPITVVKQASKEGGNAGEFTITNPYIPASTTAFRPKVVVQSSGDDNDTEKVCRNVLAAELKAISIKISVSEWYIEGIFMRPNMIVTVQSPSLWIDTKVKLFVESVDYSDGPNGKTCDLACVLPEVYNNKTPINIYETR